jgi:putative oxidoreductase
MIMQLALRSYRKFLRYLNSVSPVMLLVIRLWMAHAFWVSGVLKISDWENTLYLFTHEFPVPFLPPPVAAIFGTAFELCCPVLLTLGFAARLATLPLLVMTAVINFTYQDATEHYYWAMLLGIILFYGPGKISVDYILSKKFNEGEKI